MTSTISITSRYRACLSTGLWRYCSLSWLRLCVFWISIITCCRYAFMSSSVRDDWIPLSLTKLSWFCFVSVITRLSISAPFGPFLYCPIIWVLLRLTLWSSDVISSLRILRLQRNKSQLISCMMTVPWMRRLQVRKGEKWYSLTQ